MGLSVCPAGETVVSHAAIASNKSANSGALTTSHRDFGLDFIFTRHWALGSFAGERG